MQTILIYVKYNIILQNVLNTSIEYLQFKYSNNLKFHSLVNGYKRFDPSRGLDYILDLTLKDFVTEKIIQKRLVNYKNHFCVAIFCE